MVPATPTVRGEARPDTVSVVAAAGVTTMPVWSPVMVLVTVSRARTAWRPAVLRVTATENLWTPASPEVKV
jgi:hypothetical protein